MLTAIISLTDDCPLECDYCYVNNKKRKTMSFEIATEAINQCLNYVGAEEPLRILWHGGEPLMVGKDFFWKIMDYIDHHHRGRKIKHSLQTSGVLIDSDWISLFLQKGIKIGISLDGPRELHNAHRNFRDGTPTFDIVYNNALELQAKGIRPGFICVVTKQHIPFANDIFVFFASHGWDFSISPMAPVSNDCYTIAPTDDEYLAFYQAMLRLYLHQSPQKISVIPLKQYVLSLLCNRSVGYCTNSGSCGRNYITFDAEGAIYPCNRFVKSKEYMIGNISQGSLQAVFSGAGYQAFASRFKKLAQECASCQYFSICQGGCPHEDFVRFGTTAIHKHQCKQNRRLFAVIAQELEAVGVSLKKAV